MQGKVYVIDDSRTLRLMVARTMKELGYLDLLECDSADQAIERMRVEAPSLILSDLNMPGRSGLDLLKYVRSVPALAAVPFIMVTTVNEKATILEALKAGLQHYILKPIDKTILFSKLSTLVASHGIQAPKLAGAAAQERATVRKAEAAQLAGAPSGAGLSEKDREEIVQHFFLVFDGELTIADFGGWLSENMLAKGLGTVGDSPDECITRLRDAAQAGIRDMLRRPQSS